MGHTTRLLCTHHTRYLTSADTVVYMEEGSIVDKEQSNTYYLYLRECPLEKFTDWVSQWKYIINQGLIMYLIWFFNKHLFYRNFFIINWANRQLVNSLKYLVSSLFKTILKTQLLLKTKLSLYQQKNKIQVREKFIALLKVLLKNFILKINCKKTFTIIKVNQLNIEFSNQTFQWF